MPRHDIRERGGDQFEVAIVRRRPAEVTDAGDRIRPRRCVALAPDFGRAFQLQAVEEIRDHPRRHLREVLDARREEVVGGDRAVAQAEHRAETRHRSEPLIEQHFARRSVECLEHEIHIAVVEDQVVDVEEDSAASGARACDEVVHPRRVACPADDQGLHVADQSLEDRQLCSGEPCGRDVLGGRVLAERLDHVEDAIAKGARVGHLVHVRDCVPGGCGDRAHALFQARRPRIRKLRRRRLGAQPASLRSRRRHPRVDRRSARRRRSSR